MATITIEYNENDIHVKQVLTGLIGSGIIHHKDETKSVKISKFKTALQETMAMSADITQNGITGYKTLADLLNGD